MKTFIMKYTITGMFDPFTVKGFGLLNMGLSIHLTVDMDPCGRGCGYSAEHWTLDQSIMNLSLSTLYFILPVQRATAMKQSAVYVLFNLYFIFSNHHRLRTTC